MSVKTVTCWKIELHPVSLSVSTKEAKHQFWHERRSSKIGNTNWQFGLAPSFTNIN